jgi:tRNA (cmo5U34)-methyltransferase
MEKSTVDQIRARFDADVERFSNVEVGQQAAMDSVVALDLICSGIELANPNARDVLDVGCGAGNWTVKLLSRLPKFNVTLLDLSRPMLDRASERVLAAGATKATAVQADVRDVEFAAESFDVIVAGAVLHHLRGDDEWRTTLATLYRWLRPGGSVWIYDLVAHESPAIESLMRERYAGHLESINGIAYREKVFAYSDIEDSPRPATYQVDRLRKAGFANVDVLHKHGPFAAMAALKN